MITRALILTLAVVAAGSPATALAATGAVSGSTLTYTADSGEQNAVTVTLENGGTDFRISDAGSKESGTLTVTPGSGCIPAGTAAVACAANGITSVSIVLGDEADSDAVETNLPTTVDGGAGDDQLNGTGAADKLVGGAGSDTLQGGDGKDRVLGGDGNDSLDGGAADDTLDGGAGADALNGGAGNDALLVGPGADVMSGGDGTDAADYSARVEALTLTLDGEANDGVDGEHDNVGTDVENVTGGSGNDTIVGGPGKNSIAGGPGDDSLDGAQGDDAIDGGPGNDLLTGGQGNDLLGGGEGNDGLSGGSGADDMAGGPGSDFTGYIGRTTATTVTLDDRPDDGGPGEGDDAHSDIEGIYGGDGDDTLRGTDAPNIVVGGPGNDSIDGAGGEDVISGDQGSDVLHGGAGTDAVSYSGAESSVTVTLDGQADDGSRGENDLVAGDVENVFGGDGPDRLVGDGGPNLLVGGAGSDTLIGGGGVDTLVGGDGDDQFDTLDGGTDLADCGAGTDFVHMDAGDAPSAECEQTLVDVTLQIPPTGLRAARDGVVRIPVACAGAAGCAGWVTLTSADGALQFGLGSYQLAKGEDGLAEIELSRANYRLLAKKKVLTVLATGVVRDAQGRTSATSATFKLRPPKAVAKKKKAAKKKRKAKRKKRKRS
jgi:Ca2+-binding RTX toxin-like protein